MIKIGLIGGGRMGSVHAEVLTKMTRANDSVMLTAVADGIQETARRLAEQTGVKKSTLPLTIC